MLIQGATAHIGFNLNTINGPINLDNATVELLIKRDESTTIETKLCAVMDIGKVSVVLSPDDLSSPGSYFYQLKITFPDTTIMKSEMASFYVQESL